MRCLRLYPAFALVLIGACVATCAAYGQSINASTTDSNGTRPLPPIPGESQDLRAKYENDPTVGLALRERERLEGRLRQKQLTGASELLLKVARDLRAEMAANPKGALTESEIERLRLIQKLANLIQDREKAEDQVSAALTKTGRGP
jgi:hypothetical protein